MRNSKKWFIFFVCIFLLNFSKVRALDDIKVAIGLALPPYIIAEENKGMEYEIVKEALEIVGYRLVPEYYPFARVLKSMDEKTVDAAMTTNEQSGLKDVFYSNSHITYQNAAITLKKNDFSINNVEDLSKFSIIAFQNATLYLGDDFKKMAENNSGYKELAKQENQVAMLYKERTQVFVGDINIFNYYSKITQMVDTNVPIAIHQIFPKTNYKVAFQDKAICEKFNQGLKQLKESGRYDEIIKKYVD